MTATHLQVENQILPNRLGVTLGTLFQPLTKLSGSECNYCSLLLVAYEWYVLKQAVPSTRVPSHKQQMLLLLAGKQWLSYACLKQDRPVLVMCFYCFTIEEEVWELFLVMFQVQTGLKTLDSWKQHHKRIVFAGSNSTSVQAGAPRLKQNNLSPSL
jgi:hypothetical protein